MVMTYFGFFVPFCVELDKLPCCWWWDVGFDIRGSAIRAKGFIGRGTMGIEGVSGTKVG